MQYAFGHLPDYQVSLTLIKFSTTISNLIGFL